MDPRVSPVGLPAIEVRLRGLERLEAESLERRLLCVADPGLHFAFAIGVAHATGQRDDTVVRQDVAIERVHRRVIDVRGEDAFAQVVEHDRVDRAAQSAKGAFVELRPNLRARSPGQQPHALARVAQRQHEEARPLVLARARIAHHRPVTAVIDLAFLAWRGGDHDARLRGRRAAQL